MFIFIEQKFLILHHEMLLMTSQLLREFTIISNKKSYKNEKTNSKNVCSCVGTCCFQHTDELQ